MGNSNPAKTSKENKASRVSISKDGLNLISFDCGADELVLDAARRQGIYMASYCRRGSCGACSAILVSGEISYVQDINALIDAPVLGDMVRPCSMHARSDLELEPLSDWKVITDADKA